MGQNPPKFRLCLSGVQGQCQEIIIGKGVQERDLLTIELSAGECPVMPDQGGGLAGRTWPFEDMLCRMNTPFSNIHHENSDSDHHIKCKGFGLAPTGPQNLVGTIFASTLMDKNGTMPNFMKDPTPLPSSFRGSVEPWKEAPSLTGHSHGAAPSPPQGQLTRRHSGPGPAPPWPYGSPPSRPP